MAHNDNHNPPGQSNGQGNGQGNGGGVNGQGQGNAFGRSQAAAASMNAALALSKANSSKGGHKSNIVCMYCQEEGTHDAPLIKAGSDEYFHEDHIDVFNDLNDTVFE